MFGPGVSKHLYKCINGHFRYVYFVSQDEYDTGSTVGCFNCQETMCEMPTTYDVVWPYEMDERTKA